MEVEERCEECGSLRGSNAYCWGCGGKLPPFQLGIKMQSVGLDNAKKLNGGTPEKKKRISKRTRNKDGRWRKKRSDTGIPRKKKEVK